MSKDTNKESKLTGEERIVELLELLNQNQMQDKANMLFEFCSYVEVLEHKLDSMAEEVTSIRKELADMKQSSVPEKIKGRIQTVADNLFAKCCFMKEQVTEVKNYIVGKATDIVAETKKKGWAALQRISEFAKVKEKLEAVRGMVQSSMKDVDETIEKLEKFGKGMREVNQNMANTVRIFLDKDVVDYSQKEKRFSKTEIFSKPWRVKKSLLAGMDKYLEAAIKSVGQLAKKVEREKKEEEEDVVADVVERLNGRGMDVSMVAEDEYQYGAEKFEEYQKEKGDGEEVLSIDVVEKGKGQEEYRR